MSTEAASQIVDQMVTPPTVTEGGASTDAASLPANTGGAPKDEKISSRMDTLIRREQAALHAERAAKQAQAEVEEKLKKYADFESAKKVPKKALELLGLDYNELTQAMLNEGQITPEIQIKQINEKFEALTKSQEDEKVRRDEEQKQEAQAKEQRAITDFKSEITTYLGDNSSRYELIAFENQHDLVFEVIDEQYRRTAQASPDGIGKVMKISEAADKVELWLEQKYEKSKSVNKVKSLWNIAPKGTLAEAIKPQAKPSQPPRTLTNNLTATPTTPRKTPVSDEERVQRAIAYAKSLRA